METSYRMKTFEVSDQARWSGAGEVPAIGQRVRIIINGLGFGAVEEYFIEDRWLGVYVRLEKPPMWWVKQQAKRTGGAALGSPYAGYRDAVPARIDGCAMVFGAEIVAV